MIYRSTVLSLMMIACISAPTFAQNRDTQPPERGRGAPRAAAEKSADTSTSGQAISTVAATAGAPLRNDGVTPPDDYRIGAEDVLDVVVWRAKEMSVEGAVVRPDGKISVPLVNDIMASGLTVDQLRASITEAASKYVEQPTVAIIVKEINSRRVSISGAVAKPGQYPLLRRLTVVDLISTAGGLVEFAQKDNIRISRVVDGKRLSLRFNYKEFMEGKPKALEQNIELLTADIVTVPD